MKLSKCCQGKGFYLLWELTLSNRRPELPKKLYLKLDSSQASFGVSLLSVKPLDLLPQGGIAALVRRHLPQASVTDILRHEKTKDLLISLSSGWCIKLHADKPPVIELLDPDTRSIFRFGQKGAFTKIKLPTQHAPSFPTDLSAYHSILASLLASSPLATLPLTTPSEKEPAPTPARGNSFQADARKLLARKLKTVAAALSKEEKNLPPLEVITERERHALSLQEQYAALPAIGRKKILAEAFAAVKKAKKQRLLALPRIAATTIHRDELSAAVTQLRDEILSDVEVQEILTKCRLNPASAGSLNPAAPRNAQKDAKTRLPYKCYELADKSRILVGKTAADNDILTKQAKANDYWLHALGSEGSHVLVPFKYLPAGKLSAATKNNAGILALHYSRVRENMAGEVTLTTRLHLKKKTGFAPGKWAVAKSETFFVRYTHVRLKEILDCLKE